MSDSRVPQADDEFNAFITTSAAHLSAVSPGSTGLVIESTIPEATTQNVAEDTNSQLQTSVEKNKRVFAVEREK